MKGKNRLFPCAIAAVVLLFILAAPATAGTINTEFTGTSTPGLASAPDRIWVSEDWVLHVRGMDSLYTNVYSDPRISGEDLVTVNFNLQLPLQNGPMWGTAHIENAFGYWEGTWVGRHTAEGFSYLREVLHGHGAYEGLQARLDLARETPDQTEPFYVQGVIRDPGGE